MQPGSNYSDCRAAGLRRREVSLDAETKGFTPARPTRLRPGQGASRRATGVALVAIGFLVAGFLAVSPTLGAQGTPAVGESDEERTNVVVARRFFDELHSEGDLAVAEEIVAADAIFHVPGAELTGPEGIGGLVTVLRTAFPDVVFPIEDLVAAGDTVVVRWSMEGTSEDEFQGIPPTGEAVTMTGIAYLRFADGLIVEDWVEYNLFGLLQQLGAIPA